MCKACRDAIRQRVSLAFARPDARSTLLRLGAAAGWLAAVTAANLASGGSHRATLLFAVPVVVVAWRDWRAGFVVAAAAVLCAWLGGSLPEPGSKTPLWADGLVAFAKLSADALVAHLWSRRLRARALSRGGPLPPGS